MLYSATRTVGNNFFIPRFPENYLSIAAKKAMTALLTHIKISFIFNIAFGRQTFQSLIKFNRLIVLQFLDMNLAKNFSRYINLFI